MTTGLASSQRSTVAATIGGGTAAGSASSRRSTIATTGGSKAVSPKPPRSI